jgi:large subunit ribosomal protein L25
MASATLNATPRTSTGKGAARALRREGQVPAVVYGHNRQPQSLAINARELDRLLDRFSAASTVIELALGGGTARTLIREIQRNPVKRNIVHVDFQELVAGEKVTVAIPIRLVGTPEGVRLGGGILEQVLSELEIEVDPSSIPERIEADVSNLTIGHSLHVSDLSIPAGVTVLTDEGSTVAVLAAPAATATPAAGVEVVADEAAEPELIRKSKDDEEGGEEKK